MLQIYSTVSCWIFGLINVCFLSAQTNTFFFIPPPPPLFFTLCSFHSCPLSSCCNQNKTEFQNLSSHKWKSNMLILTLIILRYLQAGLKCSNSFHKGKKADRSPQPSLFTTSFFVGEVVFTQQYSLAHADWRHSSHWFPLCPFPPPAPSQLISQFMAGCSGCVLISPHLSLSAHLLELLL